MAEQIALEGDFFGSLSTRAEAPWSLRPRSIYRCGELCQRSSWLRLKCHEVCKEEACPLPLCCFCIAGKILVDQLTVKPEKRIHLTANKHTPS